MKKILKLCLCFLLCSHSHAQSKGAESYRNFPLIVTIQFHSLSLPFKALKSNFSNVGIGLGTEVSHNGRQNWVQQLSVAWNRNKTVGDGLFFSTQTVWRPTIVDNFYSELKVGIGYYYSFRPTESFKQEKGRWKSVGHKGKSMLAFPAGLSIGYSKYDSGTYYSPFVTYQMLLLKGYNKSIPLVPETITQAGTRVHF